MKLRWKPSHFQIETTGVLIAFVVSLFLPFSALNSWFGNWVLIPLAFWLPVIFIVYYTLLRPWWRNPMGRMLVWLDLAWIIVVFPSVMADNFNTHFSPVVYQRIQVVALFIIPVVVGARTYMLGEVNGWAPRWPWRFKDSEKNTDPDDPS